MVAILMILAKLATPVILKTKVFWNKGCEIITSVHHNTIKILSRDSNYRVDVVMRQKFGNSSISMREVITTSILSDLIRKNAFLGGSWFEFNDVALVVGMVLKLCISAASEEDYN